ncbi:hydrogenase expression/formation protein [Bradyrhizobium brasilense]|uniref:hydrogenase expression/formation protein n=1 Tax=Bradyrhizobium brasilense TaxID=1419277 RepID=UPI001E4B2678|nr:hydrogenase expression/formation protein [Bradyrhizobium brasilense]MCC8971106.1 hydrogenase expression/formation protein [Bradyrhizobium brasilense]
MKTAVRVVSEDAEQVVGKSATGTESLDVFHSGPATMEEVAKRARRDGDELARNYPNVTVLLSNVAVAARGHRQSTRTQLYGLANLSELERKLIGEVLGEGEVTGVVALPDGSFAQLREAVLAGIWRVRIGAEPAHEYVEVGAIPQIVQRAATELTSADFPIGAAPDGAMNVLAVLAEIRERARVWRSGMRAHVINLTLLPMSAVDMAFLQQSLGNGPVQLIFRGYGTCRVQATGVRNVWSVQYFNSLDDVILDTVEVGDVPIVALAAEEDFEDSAERLQEIMEAYFT